MALLCNAFPHSKSLCVNTGEVIISNNQLVTSFVKTCSVIEFSYNKLNFMAHIDAFNPNMELKLINNLKKFNLDNIKEVNVWRGSHCFSNCPSFKIAMKILKKFSDKTIINYYYSNETIIKSK